MGLNMPSGYSFSICPTHSFPFSFLRFFLLHFLSTMTYQLYLFYLVSCFSGVYHVFLTYQTIFKQYTLRVYCATLIMHFQFSLPRLCCCCLWELCLTQAMIGIPGQQSAHTGPTLSDIVRNGLCPMLTMLLLGGDANCIVPSFSGITNQPQTWSRLLQGCTSTGSLFAASWWCLGVGQEFSGQSGGQGRWGLGQKLFTKQFRSIQYFYTGQQCRCVQAVHMPWK